MPDDRHRLEAALDLLRAEVAIGRPASTELTARTVWPAFVRFGQERFDTAPTPDSDGLLFQYGTYSFGGPPMFTVDLTRQFTIVDDHGEHDHYIQVHCELRYESDPAPDDLGSFHSWFFYDTDESLDQWFDAVGAHLQPLLDRLPSEIKLYKEKV
ncbi:hypothetical protein OHA27_26905 [Streptomyces sp. NBC_01619]|uniref:hypothetical protein n=1 Tax=Streptomyces sp. NBC_01619 TaxID=2975901 RepID=UPI0022529757|nr:hypothetical protein [Streptomyces sp. NBC_01619]MCX4513885.1 hypothetical protein [Streptomyces sp. NBC_01619]